MLIQRDPNRKKYGCIMMMYDIPGFKEFLHWRIAKDDLIDIAKEPHITVLYGTLGEHGPVPENICVPQKYRDIVVRMDSKISIFELGGSDVLKLSIDPEPLLEFRRYIESQFVYCHVGHTDFNPHLTLAFVKKGTGKSYVDVGTPFASLLKADGIMHKENGIKTMV